jgi:hypothetical protein
MSMEAARNNASVTQKCKNIAEFAKNNEEF